MQKVYRILGTSAMLMAVFLIGIGMAATPSTVKIDVVMSTYNITGTGISTYNVSNSWNVCVGYTTPSSSQQITKCSATGDGSVGFPVPYGSEITYLCATQTSPQSPYVFAQWTSSIGSINGVPFLGSVSSSSSCISGNLDSLKINTQIQANFNFKPDPPSNTQSTAISTSTTQIGSASSGGIPDAYGQQMFCKQFKVCSLNVKYYNPFTHTIWILYANESVINTNMALT